jgi:hypothetical protein
LFLLGSCMVYSSALKEEALRSPKRRWTFAGLNSISSS